MAQPATSLATPVSAIFGDREAPVKGNHFTRYQAASLLMVFPTMKDAASCRQHGRHYKA